MLNSLEKKIGIQFQDKSLLKLALTHSSVSSNRNNQRLEFLGDAILEFFISKVIYERFSTVSEHYMTVMRSSLVRKETLSRLAVKLALGDFLYLGESELKGGGRQKESLLADAFEALVAAIYLDQGSDIVNLFLMNVFKEDFVKLNEQTVKQLSNSKTVLQEILQSKGVSLPKYHLITFNDDEKTVECVVSDMDISIKATANNRKKAEILAAQKVIDLFFKEFKDE